MKKREKMSDVSIKNISGISGQYQRSAQKDFMNKILEGTAVVNAVEEEKERKRAEDVKNKEILSETFKDFAEFQEYQRLKKKYAMNENAVLASSDLESGSEGGSVGVEEC